MLTLKSRFITLAAKRGQKVTDEDLDKLKALISEDLINFRGNTSYGFTAAIAKALAKDAVNKVKDPKTAKVCLLTDTSFHLLLALLEVGFERANIFIAVGKWGTHKNKAVTCETATAYTIFKRHAEASFDEEVNIIKLEEMFNLEFDLIIANPPYGKIGAQITERIIKDVKFKKFINLEPVVDYLRSSTIWTHLDVDSIQLIEGFEGAHVLPSIATFSKLAVNDLSYDEFYVETISNNLTHKFFKENNCRDTTICFDEDTTNLALDFDYSLIFGIKVAANSFNHADKATINVPGSTRSTPYALNNKLTTLKDYYASKKSKAFWGVILTFASKEERDNAFAFAYSNHGAQFLNALAYSMKRDNYHAREYQQMFPKVDWTRSWTVEEILADYGYTAEEIAEVMTDLENFKDMER